MKQIILQSQKKSREWIDSESKHYLYINEYNLSYKKLISILSSITTNIYIKKHHPKQNEEEVENCSVLVSITTL